MIYSVLWGNQNTASTRLRILNIAHLIKDYMIGVPENYEKGDVVIIQKKADLAELEKAHKEGAKVIYDIDDYYWTQPEYLKMVQQADLVTTDTEEKARVLKYDNKNVIVIPDSLDWDGTVKKETKGNVIGWTGYGNNSQYLNDIDLPKKFDLRLIASPDWTQYYKDLNAQSRPWSLAMVDKYLAECDLGIYYMPDEKLENMKGCHKLIKNWAIGLPTYTSRIPDYVKAMKEAGVGEKYLVDDWSKLKNIGFDEKCREYALKFKPEVIARLWDKTLAEMK